jgi:lipopolysaccharide/colanic/teichoic acid biosynthesis glycosyltransferase
LYTLEQKRRHEVKPGITGWAQVNGRNALSWEGKFEKDVDYVMNQSFRFDLKILFLTLKKVVKSEGINQGGQATTKYFKGNDFN